MNNPTGKGIFVWQIKNARGGDPTKIVTWLKELGMSWVAVKVTDGAGNFNLRPTQIVGGKVVRWADDILQPLVSALKAAGIAVWGWGYVYGYDPAGEAAKAIERVRKFDLAGWIIDAEGEYKGKAVAADIYMKGLRGLGVPVGLCSFRFPKLHPEFPWRNFLAGCDFHMPQVYWMQATNAGAQLQRSVKELMGIKNLPVVPVGPACSEGGWAPTVAQLDEFDRTAKALGCPGVSWWLLDTGGLERFPEFAEAIKRHAWSGVVEEPKPVGWAEAIDAWARTMGFQGPPPG